MEISKGYLQTGIYNSYGVVGTIFIDSVDNLGKMQEIVGMDKGALGHGSVAFDKLQNVAVYDGSHWVKDDGTELANWYVERTYLIEEQSGLCDESTITLPNIGVVPLLNSYTGMANCDTSKIVSLAESTEITVEFDGKKYEGLTIKQVMGFPYIGATPIQQETGVEIDFSEYPFLFLLLDPEDVAIPLFVADQKEHTVSAYTEELVEEESEDEDMIINYTYDGNNVTADKTFAQIASAFKSGKMCYATMNNINVLPLTICDEEESKIQYDVVQFVFAQEAPLLFTLCHYEDDTIELVGPITLPQISE